MNLKTVNVNIVTSAVNELLLLYQRTVQPRILLPGQRAHNPGALGNPSSKGRLGWDGGGPARPHLSLTPGVLFLFPFNDLFVLPSVLGPSLCKCIPDECLSRIPASRSHLGIVACRFWFSRCGWAPGSAFPTSGRWPGGGGWSHLQKPSCVA